MRLQPPFLLKWLFADIQWSIPSHKGVLHLTFDDGPNPSTTPLLLALLIQYNIRATFFCTGENIDKYPKLVDALKNDGHLIANHGYNHAKTFSSKKIIKNAIIGSIASLSATYRPPYGVITPLSYFKLRKRFKIVMWDVMAYDFDSEISPKQCAQIVKKKARDGSIIVFHDNEKSIDNCLRVLPELFEYFAGKGYQFTVIG